jgi:tripartite-type tricarboxylate transporter receptor subunit TctC
VLKSTKLLMAMGLAAMATLFHAGAATAQTDWPKRPVRMILPVVPGGGIDTLSRTLQNAVGEKLGKPLLIENRPSTSFIISTEIVARATDEHTIGMILVGTHAANPTVHGKLPYDTLKDFTTIINLNNSPNIIAVHPSFPAQTLADLVKEAKAAPGKHFYATSGIAGGQHFAGEMLKLAAGIDLNHLPYKGSGASLKDAISGEVKIIFGNVISAGPHIQGGSLRALAVTSLKRSPMFPDVPTVAELGYPIDVVDRYAIIGPANMPPAIVKQIHDAFRDAMLKPDLQPRLLQQGIFAELMGPDELRKFIESEIVKLREIALKANIKSEQ